MIPCSERIANSGKLHRGDHGNEVGAITAPIASWEARPERAEVVWSVGHAVDRDACWVLAIWRPP